MCTTNKFKRARKNQFILTENELYLLEISFQRYRALGHDSVTDPTKCKHAVQTLLMYKIKTGHKTLKVFSKDGILELENLEFRWECDIFRGARCIFWSVHAHFGHKTYTSLRVHTHV